MDSSLLEGKKLRKVAVNSICWIRISLFNTTPTPNLTSGEARFSFRRNPRVPSWEMIEENKNPFS